MAGGDNDFDFATPWRIRGEAAVPDAKDAKEYCELIPFDNAQVVGGFVNDTWFAFVSGNAPCSNMAVQLVPRVYVVKPDYWEIDVIGCVGEVCLTALRPYNVFSDVTNAIGHKGIVIVGTNKKQQIDIP